MGPAPDPASFRPPRSSRDAVDGAADPTGWSGEPMAAGAVSPDTRMDDDERRIRAQIE